MKRSVKLLKASRNDETAKDEIGYFNGRIQKGYEGELVMFKDETSWKIQIASFALLAFSILSITGIVITMLLL